MSARANRKAFLKNTYSGLGADFGVEYILLNDKSDEEGNDNGYSRDDGQGQSTSIL